MSIKPGQIVEKDMGYDALMDAIKSSSKELIRVGLPESVGSKRVGEGGRQTLAYIAAINHFGARKIPPRPFLTQTLYQKREEIAKAQRQALLSIITFKSKPKVAFSKVGAIAASLVKRGITIGKWKGNAESTKRKKGSSKPLIDTGRLRASITYEVKSS